MCRSIHCSVILTTLLLAPTPLIAQATWSQLNPMTLPSGRAGHGMAYDAARDRIVLFGGYTGTTVVDDTWTYDGTDWTRAVVGTPPPPRAAHPLAYDPIRQRVVLFGGISGGVALGDTWEWDGTNWLQVFPATVPPGRRSQPMVFYPAHGAVVMWGGNAGGSTTLNDTWEFNGVDWQQIVTTNAPSGRWATEMAFDPAGGGLVLFSGYQRPADTWYFNGADWQQRMPTTSPPAMFDQMMVTDWLRRRVVMLGDPGGVSQTWEWNGSDWIQRTPVTAPPARADGYLVWDDPNQRVLLFGGYTGGYINDTWVYATPNPAASANYGAGCPGTNNQTPAIGTNDGPWIGESFSVLTTNLASATAPSVALLGFSNTSWLGQNLPIDLSVIGMTGCDLLTSVIGSYPMVVQNSVADLTFPVPNSPALAGGHTYFQSAHLDPGANGLSVTASNGLDTTIGAK